MALAATEDDRDGAKSGKLRQTLTLLGLSGMAVALGALAGALMIGALSQMAVDKYKAELELRAQPAGKYSGEIELHRVRPIVTNLAKSDKDWIRLELSLVFGKDTPKDLQVQIAGFRQDILAFLRTVPLAQLEGPSGLIHLREDLAMRGAARFRDSLKEVIIETLIVQ